MAGYFYAFADRAAAVTAGALDAEEKPTVEGSIVLRETGIAVIAAEVDPETRAVITPAVMSAALVILSPEMVPGCSGALIVPSGHQGFA